MASNGPDGANLGQMASQQHLGDTRGWLYNPELDERDQYLSFLFRPEPIREQIQANYEKMSVIGMSHQYQSYSHTQNMVITFELYMNRLMMLKEGSIRTTREERSNGTPGTIEGTRENLKGSSAEIEWARRYVESLVFCPINYTGLVAKSPPAVILCLPGVVTMRCRLMAVGVDFKDVDIAGNLKEVSLKVKFEEAPLNRITMQDVISNGSFRTWGVGEF